MVLERVSLHTPQQNQLLNTDEPITLEGIKRLAASYSLPKPCFALEGYSAFDEVVSIPLGGGRRVLAHPGQKSYVVDYADRSESTLQITPRLSCGADEGKNKLAPLKWLKAKPSHLKATSLLKKLKVGEPLSHITLIEAKEGLQSVLDLQPNNLKAQESLGKVLFLMGEKSEGIKLLSRSHSQRMSTLTAKLQRLLAKEKECHQKELLMGLLKEKKFEQAKDLLATFKEGKLLHFWGQRSYIFALCSEGYVEQAARYLKESSVRDLEALYQIALYYYHGDQASKAFDCLKEGELFLEQAILLAKILTENKAGWMLSREVSECLLKNKINWHRLEGH